MKDNKNTFYQYDENICFRICSLIDSEKSLNHGNCTNFYTSSENYKNYYFCEQEGVHLHCSKHPTIELEREYNTLSCPKCKNEIHISDFNELIKKCLRLKNMEQFKDATLIKLNDWYVPELKKSIKDIDNYWIKVDVKKDKDNDTMIVLYVGKKDSNEKAQFFIKPEKLQLSHDYKDLDPTKVISKIEVTLRDRTISQKYDDIR